MPEPSLPVELHELIIDVIGSELEGHDKEDLQRCRGCLRACALVCKHWHIYTLPYNVGSLDLPITSRLSFPRKQQVGRLESLVQMMDTNPHIGRSVRSLVLTANLRFTKFDQALDKLSLHLDRVVSLRVISHYNPRPFEYAPPPNPRPLFDNALSRVLRGPQLQHLTFTRCSTFRTSSIAMSTSLKSITFEHTSDALTDHAGDPYPLASLQKLFLFHSNIILETMRLEPRFRALFSNVQHLDVTLDFTRPPQWQETCNWTNLLSLSLSSVLEFSPDDRFGSFFASIPWSSCRRLSSLSFNICFHGPINWGVAPTRWFLRSSPPLFLSEPSHLERLRDLSIRYNFPEAFAKEAWLDQALLEFYGECLNPTFEQRSGFPALETFSTSINIDATPRLSQRIDKVGLLARTMGNLPSVFGPGGRAEVDGWKVAVDGEIYVDKEFGDDDEYYQDIE